MALWLVGILCIVWNDRQRSRRLTVWTLAAVGSVGIYFAGYTDPNKGGVGYAVHHLGSAVWFFLIEVGTVVPNTSRLWLSALFGAVVMVAATAVVVRSIQNREGPLPVALIAFGAFCDLLAAGGRVALGPMFADASRYTMPNLVLVLGIAVYLWAHPIRAWVVVALVVVVLQVIVATNVGLADAKYTRQRLETGARLVVNMDRIPSSKRWCYTLNGFYSILGLAETGWIGFTDGREDHMNIFNATNYKKYRAEELPRIPACL